MGIKVLEKQSKYKSIPRYYSPKYLTEEEVEELHDIAFHVQTKAEFRVIASTKDFSKRQINEYLLLFGSE